MKLIALKMTRRQEACGRELIAPEEKGPYVSMNGRPLSEHQVVIHALTNENKVLTFDKRLIGTGGRLAIIGRDGYKDGVLMPGENVDVPFTLCLKNRMGFRLFVDVFARCIDRTRESVT